MHQTKKGNEWHFGMKAHVGVDSQSKVIHAVVVTPANTADCKVLGQLLHGAERRVYGDQAYKSQGEVIRPRRRRPRTSPIGSARKHYIDEAIKAKNQTKSRIRSRVEHAIGVIKRVSDSQGALPRPGQERQPAVRRRRRWPISTSPAASSSAGKRRDAAKRPPNSTTQQNAETDRANLCLEAPMTGGCRNTCLFRRP